MKKIKFLLVFLPLLLGVIIYLLYRSKNLFYYNFIHFLNINGYVLFARELATLYRKLFPTWVIYSLPDGLWLLSTGAVFLIARKKYLLHFFWFLFIYLFVGNCVILVLRPTPPSFMGREVLPNGIYFHIYPVRRSKCSFLLHL